MIALAEDLQSGAGACTPTHMLALRTAAVARELGAAPDVIAGALNAVHHANRHGDPDDRIAVALPGLRLARGRALPGAEVVSFGSAAALERLRDLEGVDRLLRRGMIDAVDIEEAWGDPGEPGTAFVRDRRAARRSPGAVRRARARAERRGKPFSEAARTEAPDPSILALHYGSTVVHLRTETASIGAGPIQIGTFGFSPASAPAALPILLDGADPLGG